MYISLLAFLEWLLSQLPIFLLFIGQVIVGLRWSQQVLLVADQNYFSWVSAPCPIQIHTLSLLYNVTSDLT